jgi:hypothetical protein
MSTAVDDVTKSRTTGSATAACVAPVFCLRRPDIPASENVGGVRDKLNRRATEMPRRHRGGYCFSVTETAPLRKNRATSMPGQLNRIQKSGMSA